MQKDKSEKTKRSGDSFEQEIAELYAAMGYDIRRHVALDGQEVDILASRDIQGGGEYRVIVECKYKGGSAQAGNADVQSIAGAFQIARAANRVSACVLVTNNGFSLPAQEAAKSAGMHLLTKHELVRSLIDFSSYLQNLNARYYLDFGENENSWYIDACGHEGERRLESLDDFVDKWLSTPQHTALALLGGYGTGKSSFCRHYSVRLAERTKGPIPVLLQLRNFQKAVRIESLIRDFLEEECNTSTPRFDTFWRMYSEGLLLLLFDGFDEMAARADAAIVEANLLEIERFAGRLGNVILTCRPEYFVTTREQTSALSPSFDSLSERMAVYRPIEIDLWAPSQVRRYVVRRVSGMVPPPAKPAEYYLERVERLPEISDISVRAVHLDLIVRMLPTMIEKGTPITRPNLYDAYIRAELRRETIKNRRLRMISDEDRLDLLRAIARDRFFARQDDLDFEDAVHVVTERLQVPRSEAESVTRDFLNRSFLRREGDTYRFAHKSLGEYLCAIEVAQRIQKGDLGSLFKSQSSAISGMVLEFLGGLEAFEKLLDHLELADVTPLNSEMMHRAVFAALSLNDYISGILHLAREEDLSLRSPTVWRMFTYIAHDLRSSIGALRRYGEMDRDAYIPEEALRCWHEILARVHELQRYHLNRFSLDLEYVLNVTTLDMVSLIHSCLEELPADMVDVRGGCEPVRGDWNMLRRAFENLASNAEHFMGPQGRLVVEIADDTTQVIIRFENTGDAISRENLPRVFDYGFTTRSDGHGLGLAIVKELVELHGGNVTVESENEKTAFVVQLPRD